MFHKIYSKRYGLVERRLEKWEDGTIPLSAEETKKIIVTAIEFSKRYKQGIDIIERENELTVDLYLTDHFFMGQGRAELAYLFQKAKRVDLSLGREDVLFNFYFNVE